MNDDWSASDPPGGLSEQETLARLTVDEKKRIALDAIVEFPHINHVMLHDWLEAHDAHLGVNLDMSLTEKAEVLIDACDEQVETGKDKKALDKFIYGYVYEMNLGYTLGVDPAEVAERDPLDIWEGVYDLGG